MNTISVDKEVWERQQLLLTLISHESDRINGNMRTANSAKDLISKLNNESTF